MYNAHTTSPSMTKKFLLLLLPALLSVLAITTACSNEYRDMKPGEVKLRDTDYRNDDRLHAVTVTTAPSAEDGRPETLHLSALEMRTLWHAMVINAEKRLETNDNGEKNLYPGPMDAENAFFGHLAQGMQLLQQQYPVQYRAIVAEWLRADVHAYVHYMWCAQPDEYIKLKFRAVPTEELTAIPTEELTATSTYTAR